MALVSVRRALLIVNPASRRALRRLPSALAGFAECKVACETILTVRPGHAAELAQAHAPAADAVFTLGGDGTAMEVLGALAGSGVRVGVLPGGTGNLIARALSTPRSVRRAVVSLLAGGERTIDLARMADGRRFAFAAGVGIDATMVASTTMRAKRRMGVGAYVTSGVAAALSLDRFALCATVDGVRHERRATAALVANFGSVLSGLVTLGPGISPNDGMLDLCVFSPTDARDALRLGWRILHRDFGTDPAMLFLKGRSIHIETDSPRLAEADGELVGMTPLSAVAEPGAARLLVAAERR